MPVVAERKIDCAADARALWCIITDTERLNRAIGLGRIELTANDDDTAARYLVSTVSGGFPIEYEERPYEWVENERFRVRRDVRKGAVKVIDNLFILAPGQRGGTELTVRITIEPRYGILSPIIRAQVNRFADKVARELRRVDDELSAGRPAGFNLKGAKIHDERLEQASGRLVSRVPETQLTAAKRIGDMVRRDPDAAVDRIRPFELAERWELPERQVLSACFHAVHAGLLELRWDLVCPSCMTASDRVGTLADIGEEGHCQLCDIQFDLSLDRSVEATFRPSEGVRLLDEGPYCIGGPARTPHVYAQAILGAGGEVIMRAPEVPGAHRLFVRGGASANLEIRDDGQADVSVTVKGNEDLGEIRASPGASIRIKQQGGSERHVKIERVGWKSRAATAAIVATIPEFRRLFSSEVLRRGSSMKVGRVALLFTDLTASTQLYRTVGDARAFKVVQDHFDLIGAIIGTHRGAVVKTMGDAVMAAFMEEKDALDAAVALHRALPKFRSEHGEADACYLKIGLYTGPCYAVTANGILDYFGQTVNIAARLQAEASAGETVLTASSYEALADRVAALQPERFEAELKGVGRLAVVRLHMDSEPSR